MRLPWPFGRRSPSDGPSQAAQAAPEAPAGAALAAGTPALAPPTGAWATLPPIQRTVSAPPVVAPVPPFLDAVPGHHALPPIVRPLGHDAGPAATSAPAGLVLAKPVAVPSLTSNTPLPTRPVQRRHAADEVAAAEPVAEAWSEPVAAAPIRQLPAVSAAATATPAAWPLTQATTPAPVPAGIQRSTGATSPSSSPSFSRPGGSPAGSPAHAGSAPMVAAPGSSSPAPLPAPRGTPPSRTAGRWAEHPAAGSGQPMGLGAPLAASPASPARPAAEAPPSASPSSPAVPRRAGLGAPLREAPPTSVAQRLPMATPPGRRAMPAIPAADQSPAVAASHGPGDGAGAAAMSGSAAAPGTPAARSLPVLPVARRADPGPGHTATAAHAGHDHATAAPTAALLAGSGLRSAAAVQRSAGATPTTRPTLGTRPLRPSVSAQRETAATPSGAPAAAIPGPGPVAARWSSGGDLPTTVDALAPAPNGEGPVQLQRLADPGTEPQAGGSGTPGMRSIVFPPRDGLAPAGTGPAGGPTAALALPGVQRTPSDAATAGLGFAASRPSPGSPAAARPAMTLARPAAPAPAPAVPSAAAPAPVIQRIVAEPAPAPDVHATRPGGPSPLGVTATPVVQRVDGAAPAPAADSEGPSETELDELARALFGRIRTHLRSEVIHEREAKGLTFDAF